MATRKGKKPSIDTAGERAKIVAAATRTIAPPKHIDMDEKDMDFFEDVVEEFARSEWTKHTLTLAALLARALRDMEFHQREFRKKGPIVYSEKGTPIINPLKQAIQMESGIILSLRRSLSLNARAKAGEPRDVGKRRDKAKEQESHVRDLTDDGLIPTRTVQ